MLKFLKLDAYLETKHKVLFKRYANQYQGEELKKKSKKKKKNQLIQKFFKPNGSVL
jgi:hypothetical protein